MPRHEPCMPPLLPPGAPALDRTCQTLGTHVRVACKGIALPPLISPPKCCHVNPMLRHTSRSQHAAHRCATEQLGGQPRSNEARALSGGTVSRKVDVGARNTAGQAPSASRRLDTHRPRTNSNRQRHVQPNVCAKDWCRSMSAALRQGMQHGRMAAADKQRRAGSQAVGCGRGASM